MLALRRGRMRDIEERALLNFESLSKNKIFLTVQFTGTVLLYPQ